MKLAGAGGYILHHVERFESQLWTKFDRLYAITTRRHPDVPKETGVQYDFFPSLLLLELRLVSHTLFSS